MWRDDVERRVDGRLGLNLKSLRIPWVNRANRTHLNALENLAPFAVVVFVGHVSGISSATTAACAAIYFYPRVAHAVIHVTGFSLLMARTIVFTVGWTSFVVFAATVLYRGM